MYKLILTFAQYMNAKRNLGDGVFIFSTFPNEKNITVSFDSVFSDRWVLGFNTEEEMLKFQMQHL